MSMLAALREEMTKQGLDAFIIGSEDKHQSEYVCDADMRRAFVSGFTGSAGTALVLKDKALLWTDGRYFLQAEQQLSSEWTLMKSGQKDVPDLNKWLLQNMSKGQVVGIDSWLVSNSTAESMTKALSPAGIVLKGVESNPVDIIWTSRPPAPSAPLIILPESVTGVKHTEKIANLRKKMKESGGIAVLVTMLDEIAWLLNLRGGDIAYNPVFFSYVIVTEDSLQLFIDVSKITHEVKAHLGSEVEVFPYEQVEASLKTLAEHGTVICDSTRASWRLYSLLGDSARNEISSIQLAKSLKNQQELDGMRACHIRDGAALTAFLCWLEQTVTSGSAGNLTECQAADKLEEFRGKMSGHVGPSFSTIAGYGANGAIIHYKPEPETCGCLGTDSIFLLDSGAQYLDGTTDVTRTMHFGQPTQHMKECYTAVLKVSSERAFDCAIHLFNGNVFILRVCDRVTSTSHRSSFLKAVWARGLTALPASRSGGKVGIFLCRSPLLDLLTATRYCTHTGLDYNHGTGHGVGAFLNVHEGPQGVGSRPRPHEEVWHFPLYAIIRCPVR